MSGKQITPGGIYQRFTAPGGLALTLTPSGWAVS